MAANHSHAYPTPVTNTSSMEEEILPGMTTQEYTHQASVRIALLFGKIDGLCILYSIHLNVVSVVCIMGILLCRFSFCDKCLCLGQLSYSNLVSQGILSQTSNKLATQRSTSNVDRYLRLEKQSTVVRKQAQLC